MQTEIVLISISREDLQSLIRDAVRSEFSKKRGKEILNANDVCELLDIHISTLNKWKTEGILPYRRLGKRIFFNREEVLSSLKEAGSYNKIKVLK